MQTAVRELRVLCFLVMALMFLAVAPCTAEEDLASKVQKAIERFKSDEPETTKLFEDSYGYVVFPRIEKGAAVIGGAWGEGLVYENKTPVAMAGFPKIKKGTSAPMISPISISVCDSKGLS